ncbi:hypothetical protein VST7929_02447 [Vibrio stylophorae]|uniref:Sugar ABC transporter substrate-binding protein n=1 Tax=Vibrio stylophorae TaxID=659351 RepID=A0ABN8DTW8_9VIBR|nr:SLBB domain-containing protein [Vibrio stylophorae]CAH0534504.1 hypothetical protein VST7929_02447 [Vibrio stylophorae]
MHRLWIIIFCIWIAPAFANNLAPGDSLYLQLPGESAFNEPFVIDDLGQIRLPEVGAVKVSGLSLAQAQTLIKERLSTVYRNLDEFALSIQTREIRVAVLGYVEQPGIVSIPPNSHVQLALAQAGGLRPGAQLDKFQLRRGDQVLVFNYKTYLDSGDLSKIPTLQPGDEVFVPVSAVLGNVEVDFDAATLMDQGDADESQGLTIFGELINPGTYSYKEGMTVIDAIMRAGGVTRYADVTKIRVITNDVPHRFDLRAYLDTGDSSNAPPILPSSTIFVPIEVKEISDGGRSIYVMGEVQKPGAFESSGANFLDLLANAGGPTRYADTTKIKVFRDNGAPIDINLVTIANKPNVSAHLPKLNPGDVLFVPEKTDVNEKSWLKISPDQAIKIIGAVHHPGRYEWSSEMGFLDLLAHAGGPIERANLAQIRIIHTKGTGTVDYFDLDRFLQQGGDFSTLPRLQAGDTVVIDELPHDPTDNKSSWVRQSAKDSIYIFGAVGAPGRYAFNQQLGFLDIVAAADGPNPNADLRNIKISHRTSGAARVSHINLQRYFETGDETLIAQVVPGDVIYIPERRGDWLEKKPDEVVRLVGAIKHPGRYRFSDEMSILDLIAEAGGTTEQAWIDNIMIVNKSCCGDRAHVFSLKDYVHHPSRYPLPLLRAGDTVYVPFKDESGMEIARQWLRDALGVVTLVVLGASL